MGWFNIYAAIYSEDHSSIFDISQSYGRQMIWIIAAVLMAFVILMVEVRFFSTFAFLIYALTIFLLILVLFIGAVKGGSKSWFQIGDFGLQPAEFAKFATALALAKYFDTSNLNLKRFKTKIITLVILAIPAGLILLQNDTGSAIVYLAFILVIYREGMSGNIILLGILGAVLFLLPLLFDKFLIIGGLGGLSLLIIFIMRRRKKIIFLVIVGAILSSGFVYSVDYVFENILEPHQKTRINVLLGKETDLRGAGYNVHQSKIAIGSGGITGKGFLKGTQTKFDFVPEQSTDFIFCTVGEEWGFIGTTSLIILFITLFLRIIQIAERQRSTFSRIYGYSVAAILFFHFLVNIGMTIGFTPVIGIPLPFLSYGGSSLWGFTILLFIFIKLDAQRLDML